MNPVAIYKITNKENGKLYIGQSINPKKRFQAHKRSSSPCLALKKAISKYGKKSFEMEVLVWCPDKIYADDVEIKLIEAYKTCIDGYNIREGGSSTSVEVLRELAVLGGNSRKRTVAVEIEGAIKIFDSIRGASIFLGVHEVTAQRYLRENKSSKWGWSIYYSDGHFEQSKDIDRPTNKKEFCLTKNNVVKIFDSFSEAGRQLGVDSSSICAVVRGRRKSAGGWRLYIEGQLSA